MSWAAYAHEFSPFRNLEEAIIIYNPIAIQRALKEIECKLIRGSQAYERFLSYQDSLLKKYGLSTGMARRVVKLGMFREGLSPRIGSEESAFAPEYKEPASAL